MNIVIDTNIFYNNWYLEGLNINLLEGLIEAEEIRLIIPEIVLLEIKNLYRKELEQLLRKVGDNAQQLSRFAPGKDIVTSDLKLDELCADYNNTIDKRLKHLQAEITGHKDVPHKVLIEKSLKTIKPFKEKDQGYRDALLWDVILNKIADPTTNTYFITNNVNDFGEKEEDKIRLHKQLVLELESKGLPKNSVVLYTNLTDFVREIIIPYVVKRIKEAVKGTIQKIKVISAINIWLSENRETVIKTIKDKKGNILNYSYEIRQLEDIEIKDLSHSEKIDIENFNIIGNQKAYVNARTNADLVLEGLLSKSDYHVLENKAYLELEILDFEWSKLYMLVQAAIRVPISLTILWDIEKLNIIEVEIDVKEFFGWCPFCNEPVISDAAESCPECGRVF